MLPKLRGVYLHHLNRDFIMDVVDRLPCSNSTKNRYIALIRSILYKAQNEWGWIDKVPKLKLKKEAEKRIRWLKPEEAEQLINALPDDHWRAIAKFSFCTGLRQRNVFGLRWEQVDLNRKTAWIYPDEAKAGRPIGVPLNDVAIRVLSERMGIHKTYVFTNRDLCKKALPPTAETQTQVFVYFRPPKSLLILPKYPLNPPRIPDNQASGPPFRQQQAHLAC